MSLNFFFGRWLSRFQEKGKSVIAPEKYASWQEKAAKLVPIIGLLSWAPIFPGVLMVASGFLRVSAKYTLLFILIGQGGYYAYQLMA